MQIHGYSLDSIMPLFCSRNDSDLAIWNALIQLKCVQMDLRQKESYLINLLFETNIDNNEIT